MSRMDAARILGVTLLYFLAAKLGLMSTLVSHSVSLFWPASGLALTALLVFGLRVWPGILIGAWLGNSAEGWIPSLEIAIGATLATLAGAWMLRRTRNFDLSLVTVHDVFALLAAAGVSALISALNGAFWLAFNGHMAWASYSGTVLFWWMGDTLGIILFVPLALSWLRHKPMPGTPGLRREVAIYLASLLLLCFAVFFDFGTALFNTRIGSVILLPIIVWSALRFNMRLTALGSVVVFLFSMIGMAQNTGTFAPMTLQSIREVWIYNLVMGVTGLVLAVVNYQRRRTNESLELSRAELQRAQAVAQTGSWSLDIRNQRLRWSEETYRIFGISPERQLTLELFLECVHPDDRKHLEKAWQIALRGTPYDVVHRILVDGRIKWVREKAEVDFDVDGKAVSAIGTCRDITPLRETEERLHLSTKVFDNSGEGILITDADARIIAANSAFSGMTGYSETELIGQTPRLLSSGLHDADFYRDMWAAIKGAGRWQGEIWDRHKSGRVFPKWLSINAVRDDIGKITHYIAISNDITERKENEKSIHLLAYYDVLTGLPNRTLLHDRLEQMVAVARRDRDTFALLFLDLDRFKYVNDSMGHTTGDKLLQAVAQRLQECVREGDTVARLGGDEFIVLLRETDAAGAARVAGKILAVLAAPYDIGNQQIATCASIGISIHPDHGDNADMLIKNADVAMYRAKDEGRNNFQFYAPEMDLRANQMFWMEKDLRLALERNEFSLHYQPQVRLNNGRVCGVEALLRWKHPEKGYIPPSEFIPVAEETGQIIAIGEWVLRTACMQLAEWRRNGMAAFPLSVNVSIRQLRQPALAEQVSDVLNETRLPPGDLELELTEGMMMGDTQTVLAFLAQMHNLGVRLSIDDFGTGFSSLNYLKKLPLDRIKIDRSFVRDIETDENDAAIVRSIVSLGHRLKLRVVAEGVETLEQLDFLRIRGCDEIQGFYFSRPLPADEFARFIGNIPNLNNESMARAMA